MLKANVLWPGSRRYKSRTEWEPIGFFSEALCYATQFDIKLGFFLHRQSISCQMDLQRSFIMVDVCEWLSMIFFPLKTSKL